MVFLAPVWITSNGIQVGQPELLTYRNDQGGFTGHRRMNCLTFRKLDGDAFFGKTSDKYGVRNIRIPQEFLNLLANQPEHQGVPTAGWWPNMPNQAQPFQHLSCQT